MHVIDEGIFRGFLPVNHHWVNDDPGTYYDISNSVKQSTGTVRIDKRRLSAFDLEGYQVVRGQFMQLRFEGPCITISNERISFNKFCVQKFENVAFIQLLLHPAERKIAIRPCDHSDAHSIKWRPDSNKPIYIKTLNCQHFGNALYSIMGWNPDYVYKIRGTWACRGVEQIIVFNLLNAMPAVAAPSSENEDSTGKRRINLFPEEWDDDFGAEFYEHILENGFYYIAPNSEWHSQAKSILAPGIEQYAGTSPEALQLSIESLRRGMDTDNGQPGT